MIEAIKVYVVLLLVISFLLSRSENLIGQWKLSHNTLNSHKN